MDTNTMFVWIIVILGISALVVYFHYKNKKTEEKKLLPLHNFAKENNSIISSSDHWDKTLIGMENSGVNKLFFIRKVFDNELKKMINLSEIKNSRVVKTVRAVQFNKEIVHVIDKIVIAFSFIEANKPEVTLEFYNSDYDHLNLTGELQLAEKWSENVNSLIGIVTNKGKKSNDVKSYPASHQLQVKAGKL